MTARERVARLVVEYRRRARAAAAFFEQAEKEIASLDEAAAEGCLATLRAQGLIDDNGTVVEHATLPFVRTLN